MKNLGKSYFYQILFSYRARNVFQGQLFHPTLPNTLPCSEVWVEYTSEGKETDTLMLIKILLENDISNSKMVIKLLHKCSIYSCSFLNIWHLFSLIWKRGVVHLFMHCKYWNVNLNIDLSNDSYSIKQNL
jgi:hypothetical protein